MNNWTWPPREHKGWRKNCYTVVKSSQIDLNMGYNMHEQTIYDVTPVVVNGDMSSWTSDDKLSAYLFSRQKWRFWNDKFYVYGWKPVKELSNIDETWQLCQWMTSDCHDDVHLINYSCLMTQQQKSQTTQKIKYE